MTMRSAIVTAFITVASLSACHSPDEPRVDLTYEDYLRQQISAECASIFNCCDASRIDQTKGNYTDAASCVTYETHNADFTLSPKLRFDPVAAGRCLAAEQASLGRCELERTISNGFGQCPEAFIGMVPEGESCSDTGMGADPCVAGSVCYYASDTGASTCVKARTEGQSCGPGQPCESKLHCAGTGTCIVPRAAGGACDHDNFECDSLLCADTTCLAVDPSAWVCYYDPS